MSSTCSEGKCPHENFRHVHFSNPSVYMYTDQGVYVNLLKGKNYFKKGSVQSLIGRTNNLDTNCRHQIFNLAIVGTLKNSFKIFADHKVSITSH